MPNRIIKESIRTSKKVNSLNDFEYRMWSYAITYVDDYGRGIADPAIIKGFVFPLRKEVKESDITKALKRMDEIGLIRLYKAEGETYFYFPNWSNHQRIQKKHSKYPEPPADGEPPSVTVEHGEPPSVTVSNGYPPLESNTIQSESEYESNPNQNTNTNSASVLLSEQESWFLSFWEKYPRKVDKKNSQKVFNRVCKDEETYGKIMIGLEKQIPTWRDPKYIPHPSTWLNGERWNDETSQPVFSVPFPEVMNEFG